MSSEVMRKYLDHWKHEQGGNSYLELYDAAERTPMRDSARITQHGRQVGTSARGTMKKIGSVPEDVYARLRLLFPDELNDPGFWEHFFRTCPEFSLK